MTISSEPTSAKLSVDLDDGWKVGIISKV